MTQGLQSPTFLSGSQIWCLIFQSSVKGSLRKRACAGAPPRAPEWIRMCFHTPGLTQGLVILKPCGLRRRLCPGHRVCVLASQNVIL